MTNQHHPLRRWPWMALTVARRNTSLSVGGTHQRLTVSHRGLSLSLRMPGTSWTWTWRWRWRQPDKRQRERRRADIA